MAGGDGKDYGLRRLGPGSCCGSVIASILSTGMGFGYGCKLADEGQEEVGAGDGSGAFSDSIPAGFLSHLCGRLRAYGLWRSCQNLLIGMCVYRVLVDVAESAARSLSVLCHRSRLVGQIGVPIFR